MAFQNLKCDYCKGGSEEFNFSSFNLPHDASGYHSRQHSSSSCLILTTLSYLFIYLFLRERERERERERGREGERGRGRERGRQRIPSRLHTISAEPEAGLNTGLELTNSEIMT